MKLLYMYVAYMSRGDFILSPFYIRLKEIRENSGKKQREAAAAAGVQVRTYQFYESGRNEPNIAKLIALADFFNVSLDYLMGRKDEI